MIFEDSRYANCEYTSVTGRDGITRKYLHPRDPVKFEDVEPDWAVHDVEYGDQLDLLAHNYTGKNASKAKYWWLIADANDIMWPLDLEPGTQLAVPTTPLTKQGIG